MPDQIIFFWTNNILQAGSKRIMFCLEPRVAHSMKGLPFPGLKQCRFCCRTPVGIIGPVLNIKIHTWPVGGQVKKSVAVYTPYLRRSVKSKCSPGLGYHGMKSSIGEVVHPWNRRIISVYCDFPFVIIKLKIAIHIISVTYHTYALNLSMLRFTGVRPINSFSPRRAATVASTENGEYE